eukprot:7123715-Prymnesium_polylepis.1
MHTQVNTQPSRFRSQDCAHAWHAALSRFRQDHQPVQQPRGAHVGRACLSMRSGAAAGWHVQTQLDRREPSRSGATSVRAARR